MFSRVLMRAEHVNDVFARTWMVWCCIVLFSNLSVKNMAGGVDRDNAKDGEANECIEVDESAEAQAKKALDRMESKRKNNTEPWLELEKLNLEQMVRRAGMIREQGEDESGIKATVDIVNEPAAPKCNIEFIVS